MKQNIFPVRIVEYENIDNVKSLLKRKTLKLVLRIPIMLWQKAVDM